MAILRVSVEQQLTSVTFDSDETAKKHLPNGYEVEERRGTNSTCYGY